MNGSVTHSYVSFLNDSALFQMNLLNEWLTRAFVSFLNDTNFFKQIMIHSFVFS